MSPAAAPALAVGAPRLQKGDELAYSGTINEIGERPENRFRKRHILEVRVFVLEATAEFHDCAVFTSVKSLDDEQISQAVRVVSGSTPAKAKNLPTVHLRLIRVDARGRVKTLEPNGPPPLSFDKVALSGVPVVEPDAIPIHELGFFVPLPVDGARVGSNWAITEGTRPPLVFTAKGESVWNGGRCVELTATQQSTGWDRPNTTPEGWFRSEIVFASPEEGYANTVEREFTRRLGRETIGRMTVKYELLEVRRHLGRRHAELRSEIETAWYFSAEPGALASPKTAQDRQDRVVKLRRYAADHPNATSYRPVLDSLLARLESGKFAAPPASIATIAFPTDELKPLPIGSPVPDFVVPDVDKPTGKFRLSANQFQPTIAIFFKPGSATSHDALSLAELLHRHYGEKVSVIPLALGAKPDIAAKQREQLQLTVPIYDGAEIRDVYRVTTFPHIFLIEPGGLLNWTFDAGIGPETGFLVKKHTDEYFEKRGKR